MPIRPFRRKTPGRWWRSRCSAPAARATSCSTRSGRARTSCSRSSSASGSTRPSTCWWRTPATARCSGWRASSAGRGRAAGMFCPIVRRNQRGRGLGGELLRAGDRARRAAQLGIGFAAAGIGTRNRGGYSLLTSHGFRPVRQHFLMRCERARLSSEPPPADLALEVARARRRRRHPRALLHLRLRAAQPRADARRARRRSPRARRGAHGGPRGRLRRARDALAAPGLGGLRRRGAAAARPRRSARR